MTDSVSDNIGKLYDYYNVLVEAGDKIGEHEQEYLEILSSIKGTANEKRLASQFIAKFFKHFPTHYDKAIDALLDLCEDEDINIRKQAIRDLPTICKDCKEYVPRITDILAQLLVAEDASELQIVNNSLITVCKVCPKGFLGGLFSQIESGEDATREKITKFLSIKMKTLPSEIWTKEIEEYFLQECRKVIQDCTKDEFIIFMNLLSGLKITKTISGQQVLVEMITEQAELEVPFNPADSEMIDKFLMCVRSAIPHFSPFVPSNAYVQYICTQLIPSMTELTATMSDSFPAIELDLLQLLSELVVYVQPTNTNHIINVEECQGILFSKLLEFMPLPALENESGDTLPEEPSFQLTHVECLLHTFHTLGKSDPGFLDKAGEETMKDFRARLQYLARGVQNYIKKLKEALSSLKKTSESAKNEENRLKLVALKTNSNINTLIRDLFHPKPIYKATVQLSWKPSPIKNPVIKTSSSTAEEPAVGNANSNKRKLITAPESDRPRKEFKQVYAPPSGKFSSNFRGGYSDFRGRGRSRGSRGRFGNRYSY